MKIIDWVLLPLIPLLLLAVFIWHFKEYLVLTTFVAILVAIILYKWLEFLTVIAEII